MNSKPYHILSNSYKNFNYSLSTTKSVYFAILFQSSTEKNNPERYSLEQLKNNKRKLESFKTLPNGWNGYNSEKINEELIEKTKTIISDLEYQPQIFPTGRSSIQIEKYRDDENFVEIEISNDKINAYYSIDGIEAEKQISIEEINDLIKRIYA